MNRFGWLLGVAILLPACVGNVDSSTWDRTYSKQGVSAQEVQNDALDCVPPRRSC